MVVHSGGRDRWISAFKASLFYRVSSRTAMATQRNLVWKNQTTPRHATPGQQNPLNLEVGGRERKLTGNGQGFETSNSDTPPLTRPHLLILPKQFN